jgi:hypothetical protein
VTKKQMNKERQMQQVEGSRFGRSRSWLTPLTVATAAMALAACSGSSGDPAMSGGAQGSLSVSLMDAPVDEVAELWIRINTVRVKPAGDGPPLEYPLDPALDVDLLTLDEDNAVLLLDSEPVEAGEYNWIELIVDAEFDGNYYSRVVANGGGEYEVQVPSGSVRLVSGFTVTANGHTRFLIDWDTRRGLVNPPGLPGYLLRPAFRVIDLTEYGVLSGTVAMDLVLDESCTNDLNLDTGNAVYVYDDHGVDPYDVDGTDPDPVAILNVRQDEFGEYVYSTLLSPGDYTVAFTCQASDDHPDEEDDIEFIGPTDVTVEVDGAHVVNFDAEI